MFKKVWLLIAAVTLAFGWHAFSENAPKKAKDLIKFSHKFHSEEVGTTCVDCHGKASQSASATDNLMATKPDCEACHDVEDEENCGYCHIGDEENFLALPVPENELVFSHKFHVEEQDMACETCHTNLAEVDYANEESMPAMDACATCHDNQLATMQCVACHTNTLGLRPVDHSPDFLMAHKNIARIDQEECATCHVSHDCAECHEGAALFTTSTGDILDVQSSLSPSSSFGTKNLLLSRVHEPNFRLTHPLAATGRTQECATCHDTQDFCQTCHEAEGVDVAGKPVWHGGPDWAPLPGSGASGGRHAELARRDLESCIACHSADRQEPVCMLCHQQ